jgi:hypothetical protein
LPGSRGRTSRLMPRALLVAVPATTSESERTIAALASQHPQTGSSIRKTDEATL